MTKFKDMIYFDEAGNSGGNLLDETQPTYILLSHNYSDDEAQEILSPLLSISKASELHFTRLKKYSKSREAILRCINHKLIEKERIFHFVAHKKFMIVIHIVDQLFELVMHAMGEDIYKGGANLATANLLYIMGNNAWDKKLFDIMCNLFVKWMRSNLITDCITFYDAVAALYFSVKTENEKMLLYPILASKPFVNQIMESHDKYRLDATLSCFNAHCHFWAAIYEKPFDIVFDNSKQIDYWKDLIDFLTNSVPEKEVGYGSRKHKYPLLINSLQMQNSKESIEVQLADVLASSLNFNYSEMARGPQDSFSKQIDESALIYSSHNSMWPGTEVTPEALLMTDEEGINPLDFIAYHAMKQNEK
ncbi:MAG: DUF3800 domain-containing protein [Bacteroidetes bacterium]|nr:DUF3800 domain-containing protein [Bacteroidota bacterium]